MRESFIKKHAILKKCIERMKNNLELKNKHRTDILEKWAKEMNTTSRWESDIRHLKKLKPDQKVLRELAKVPQDLIYDVVDQIISLKMIQFDIGKHQSVFALTAAAKSKVESEKTLGILQKIESQLLAKPIQKNVIAKAKDLEAKLYEYNNLKPIRLHGKDFEVENPQFLLMSISWNYVQDKKETDANFGG